MKLRRFLLGPVALVGIALVAGCSGPATPDGTYDPYQAQNRQIHAFNKKVDRAVIRPAAKIYAAIVPKKPATLINNFAFNFSEPRNVVNDLLQGRLHRATEATLRFVVNTTFGIGGLFDMADKAGVPGRTTDFGETLYVWGFNEGPYIELPVVGPSTGRHTVGRVADLFTNPLTYILPVPENYLGTASSLAWALDTREQFAGTVNDILDNSADSYSQAQILYLQSRRHKLGSVKNDVVDPFQELGLAQN
jgi:phospholipid-binding lipoprotein MlaA